MFVVPHQVNPLIVIPSHTTYHRHSNALKYQQMADRASNPGYLTGLQRDLYRSQLRPGPNNVPQLVDQALAVETRPGRPLRGHVP